VLSSFFAYTIFNYLQLDGILNTIFVTIIQLILSFSIVWFFYRSVRAFQVFAFRLAAKTESDLDDQLVPLVAKTLRVTIIVLGILITIQNFGINVMSLLAGLGLGGLAFALAAKDTAANFIGSIMILLDNPFKVGDWIVTNGAEGTVEEIGFRSTRIRTFYNSLVSLPNSSLVNANIDNMGKREFRRVKATLGVVYSTPPEQVLKFIEGIKEIIKKNPSTRKDYYHVRFTEYSASSLDILLYYFLQVNDWGDELEQKEAINIQILKLAKELDVSFAFPTQSIFLEKTQQD
jgi:MscS family membrane protein